MNRRQKNPCLNLSSSSDKINQVPEDQLLKYFSGSSNWKNCLEPSKLWRLYLI
ncbi:hypothetical protein Syun_028384 [Stephania yunnanensis]|uniref:Uncharacterized protein n=1 Tax=Stephania yunnanensis TaxID=152371 RepID=A0AAP0EPL7_9MAGN